MLQSVAHLTVLKFNPNQARHPKGSSQGGEFAKGTGSTGRSTEFEFLQEAAAREQAKEPPPTHARRADVEQVAAAFQKVALQSGLPDAAGQGIHAYTVRSDMKKRIQMDLTERLKNHPAFQGMDEAKLAVWVKAKIDLWAETSGDHDADAIHMQEAVRLEFGLPEHTMQHLADVESMPWTTKRLNQPMTPTEEARNRAFVRAEYDRTQEWLKAEGITHVSVFRGMYDGYGDLGWGFETVQMAPASSWSTDLKIAAGFAQNQMEKAGGFDPSDPELAIPEGTVGLDAAPKVLTTRVPASQVLSTCVTGRGCLVEYEIILIGKEQRARVFRHKADIEKTLA